MDTPKKRHGIENLRPIKKGEVRNPKGRPKSTINMLKGEGYTISDVKNRIRNLIFLTIAELGRIYEDPSSMMIDKIIANALRHDLKKGIVHTLETLLTRVYGAPKQSIETTGEDGGPIKYQEVRKIIDKDHMVGVFETALKVLNKKNDDSK